MNRVIIILTLLLSHVSAVFSQGVSDSISHRLQEQLRLFPQEKVALHVDRTALLPGDTVRLKAYVVDASTLLPQLDDQFVYVELLDAKNKSLQRIRLIASNNLYTGYIQLPADQEQGFYYLWAYTLYSAQVKNYECVVPIQVGSSEPDTSPSKTIKPVLRFYPEGGYLVEGTTCMVAFEATTESGDSLEISGEVVDSHDDVVSQFKTFHHGLGFFPLNVERGESYKAVCRDQNGKKYAFPLPKARADAICLHCHLMSDEVQVIINSGTNAVRTPLYLLVHCRGRMVRLMPVKRGATYHLPFQQLPAGVNSLLLLDGNSRVLSERLVFSNNLSQHLPVSVDADHQEYGLRDSIPLWLSLPDMKTDEIAFLSLSVTDDSFTHNRHAPSLWSQLLLASDIQGLNGRLDEYFKPVYQADKLDLLMMVNGWRRYDLNAVLQGQYSMPSVEKEKEQRISGRVHTVFSDKPVGETQVVLAITKQKYIDTATTDSTGHFEFHGLNFPSDADAFVYATRQKKRRCFVEIDKAHSPYTPEIDIVRGSAKMLPWVDIDEELLEKYARESHLLQEVIVKGQRGTSSSLDNTTLSLDRQAIEAGEYHDLGFLLLCTNMLWVDYESGSITADPMLSMSGIDKLQGHQFGQTSDSIGAGTEVKLYVNGLHIPNLTFSDLELDDIDRVDLYLGPKAWVLDPTAKGVVNITTRNGINRSTENIFNNKVVRLTGYQAPVEYYFPRYAQGEKPSQIQPDMRRTLYWNPYLRMGKDTPLNVSFFSADLPTKYTIRVEGITNHGRIVDGDLKIKVKD